MDDEMADALTIGCGTCGGLLAVFLVCLAAFTYACILIIDAIQS